MKANAGTRAKVRFPSRKEEARGVMELARRVRVIAVGENDTNFFIVPTEALTVLKEQNIQFEVVGNGGFDYAVQALRSAATQTVQ